MPIQPTNAENEYFARQEYERMKKIHDEIQKKLKEDEKRRLKELHYMHCPKCGSKMMEITFRAIAVDECPCCGGLFFDKGELEQIHAKDSGFLKEVFSIFR